MEEDRSCVRWLIARARPDNTQMKRKPMPCRNMPATRKVRMDINIAVIHKDQSGSALTIFASFIARDRYRPLSMIYIKTKKLAIPKMPVSAIIST